MAWLDLERGVLELFAEAQRWRRWSTWVDGREFGYASQGPPRFVEGLTTLQMQVLHSLSREPRISRACRPLSLPACQIRAVRERLTARSLIEVHNRHRRGQSARVTPLGHAVLSRWQEAWGWVQ